MHLRTIIIFIHKYKIMKLSYLNSNQEYFQTLCQKKKKKLYSKLLNFLFLIPHLQNVGFDFWTFKFNIYFNFWTFKKSIFTILIIDLRARTHDHINMIIHILEATSLISGGDKKWLVSKNTLSRYLHCYFLPLISAMKKMGWFLCKFKLQRELESIADRDS